MSDLPAGWYDDGSGAQRWWDGSQWTEQTLELIPPGDASQPRSSKGLKMGAGLAVAALVIGGGTVGALAAMHVGPFTESKNNAASTATAVCTKFNASTIAGNGVMSGSTEGEVSPGPALSKGVIPYGVAVGSNGNVYLADVNGGYVDQIAPDGNLSFVAQSSLATYEQRFGGVPSAIASDAAGNLYVGLTQSDGPGTGGVVKIALDGSVTAVAGDGSSPSGPARPTPGPATSSTVDAAALAVDRTGNVYIADYSGYVLKVSTMGDLSIVAGNGNNSDRPRPGIAIDSPLYPTAIAVDAAGNLYIGDTPGVISSTTTPKPLPGYVVKVAPTGVLSVVAGNGQAGAPAEGPALASPLNPAGLTLDATGNLYIADRIGDGQPMQTGYVARVSPSGELSILAGNGMGRPVASSIWLDAVPAPNSGPAKSSPIVATGIAVDAKGSVYVAEGVYGVQNPGNGYLVKLTCG